MIEHFRPLLTLALVTLSSLTSVHAENRSIDGTGNSTGDRGAAHTPFKRLSPAAYEDGLSSLGGASRPNARDVSNRICDQAGSEPNLRGGSDYIWQWGQFVDHDITLSPADTAENGSIPINDEDDPLYNFGFPYIPMARTDYTVDGTGVRQQVNAITSFIDASNVYGSDATTANALREFSGGRLKTGPDGLLPFNTMELPMAGVGTVPGIPAEQFRMAGDVRANEQSCLTAMHTLFMQEHNRLSAELAASHPTWTDEQLYQRARKIVGALIQSITYNEWLPALLGPASPDIIDFSYDPLVDPSISNVFATALFRFGHTMVSPQLMRIHDDNIPDEMPNRSLMSSFFNPPAIESPAAYEFLLKGLACQLHQDADGRIISQLRNTLFGEAGHGGMDLAALNIQRGRDHGLPDYNTVREVYGLTPITTWEELSSDEHVRSAYNELYSSVDDLDLWTAALSEDHLPGAAVGETVAISLAAEFTRLAVGDRFFYLWDDDLSPDLREEMTATTLSEIITRNTNLTLQKNVFFLPDSNLAMHRIRYLNGTGVELTFMAKPGYEYRVKYGTSPDALDSELFSEPVTTAAAAYMIQCVDIEAKNVGERYYQLLETPLSE